MILNPSLNLTFNGQCEEAFRFYERCLEGSITFMLTWGAFPMAKDAPPEWSGKILHATLMLNNLRLQGADALPGSPEIHAGFCIMLGLTDAGQTERLFAAFAEGGSVNVPLEETFWALRFGQVVDRFGIPWGFNCEKPAQVAPQG
jgi:PhnB protein